MPEDGEAVAKKAITFQVIFFSNYEVSFTYIKEKNGFSLNIS